MIWEVERKVLESDGWMTNCTLEERDASREFFSCKVGSLNKCLHACTGLQLLGFGIIVLPGRYEGVIMTLQVRHSIFARILSSPFLTEPCLLVVFVLVLLVLLFIS